MFIGAFFFKKRIQIPPLTSDGHPMMSLLTK